MKYPTSRSPAIQYDNHQFLTANDPHPVEIQKVDNAIPVLVVCDHAGNSVPKQLQNRMPNAVDMNRHIAIDVGARMMAQTVAKALHATLVMQRYSRLVIDMNRPLDSPELCPPISDGTTIPFNHHLSAQQKAARINAIFKPYHNAIAKICDDCEPPIMAMVAIHSFSPQLRNQPPRRWHGDLISRTSIDVARDLRCLLQVERPDLQFGVNSIFAVTDTSDYTIRSHAETRGLQALSIEIRNDLLTNDDNILYWGRLLAKCLATIFADHIPKLYFP